jgi:hypothetical protein
MYVKGACLAAALTVTQIVPANSREVWIFHPYVPLGSQCQGTLADSRLAGIPVPLGAGAPDCAGHVEGATAPGEQPRKLIFNARTGRIVGTQAYE